MSTKQAHIEVERSLALAQSSLNRQDIEGFCAAVKDLQKLVQNQSGQWQSAVNFLARSIQPNSLTPTVPTRPLQS
jgi:hypothetical protein